MRIASMILNDFTLFKDSGISELSITFSELVQIIIGSNGSGKSSTLRELSVYPTVRSLFGKRGFKSLVVEKDGVYYRLESEYEKPSSPHLFFEGDSEENLNIGRTTETQQELIIHHLGITPLVDDLIMNRYVFPKWGASKRKEFLMGANPDQIGFVLTLIKQTASKIKACKANLARLQSRKILLEQDLINDDEMASLTQEKEIISNELGQFQQNLMDLEVGLRTIPQTSTSFSLTDLPTVRTKVKQCHYKLHKLSHISRDDNQRQRDRETVLSNRAVCDQRLSEADETILEYSSQLVELETRYRELNIEGDLRTIEETITRLESDRDKLQIARPSFEISREDLEARYRELETLINNLHIFNNLTIPLISSKRRQQRERKLSSAQYKQSSYGMRMADLQNQFDDLSKRHSLTPKDIPDSPCAKDQCPLYSHFMGQYENTEAQRQTVQKAMAKGRHKIARLDNYVNALNSYFTTSAPYNSAIQWLVNHAQTNPILHHVLRNMDILMVLSTNPNQIARKLQDEYDRIDQWLKLKTVLADLETAYAFKSRQISSESHDVIKLVSSIDGLKRSLRDLRQSIQDILAQKRQHDVALAEIEKFSDIKSTILLIQRQQEAITNVLADTHERDKLSLLRKGVEELRARHFLRMSDIERTLRSQTSLRDRYQEEIISQIGQIEKELSDLQQTETALIAIPKENMVGFINTVFDQANRLIETIWTVPLKIELLNIDDPLTYEFQVSGDNQSLREMSKCSEGQTEILSLAINLSLRIILGHLNYPLCLDEAARTFDEYHRQNLIFLLKRLLDDKIVSQLFFVSHHAAIHEAFHASETFVVREDNIMLPTVYNQHVTLR